MISIFKKKLFLKHILTFTHQSKVTYFAFKSCWGTLMNASKSDMEEKKWLNKVVILVFFVHKKYSHNFMEW